MRSASHFHHNDLMPTVSLRQICQHSLRLRINPRVDFLSGFFQISMVLMAIGWIINPYSSFAQAQGNLDSLRQAFNSHPGSREQMEAAVELARVKSLQNPDSALILLDQALIIAQKTGDRESEAKILFRKIVALRLHGDQTTALQLNRSALVLADDPSSGSWGGKIYHTLSHFFMEDLASDSCLYFLQKAEIMNDERGEHYANYLVYADIANNYENQKRDKEEEIYLLKAYEVSRTKMIRKDHGLVLYLMMQFYFGRNQMAEYARYAREYLDLVGEDEDRMKNDKFHNVLYFFEPEESTDDKIARMQTAIKEQTRLEHWNNLIISYDYLTELEENGGYLTAALDAALHGLKLTVDQKKLYQEKGFLEIIAHLYEKMGQPARSLSYLKQTMLLEDSLRTKTMEYNLQDLEVKYQTRLKEEELLKSNLQLDKKKMENTLLFYISGSLLALAGLSLGFVRYKSRINSKLESQNRRISDALEEKEGLLREIHHRVKNNLQIVSSLLNLHSKKMQDESSKAVFKDGQNRVKSMAIIHQNLYLSEDLAGMNVNEYIRQLTHHLFHSFHVNDQDIRLHTDIDDVVLDVETLIPLGLILNELLSNTLKHAFTTQDKGEINVMLRHHPNELVLTVKGNGRGISKSELDQENQSFGLRLIRDFARKLEAEMEISNHAGTWVEMHIRKFRLSTT